MPDSLSWLTLFFTVASFTIGLLLIRNRRLANSIEEILRGELDRHRAESQTSAKELRTELSENFARMIRQISSQFHSVAVSQTKQFDRFSDQLAHLTRSNNLRLNELIVAVEKKLREGNDDARLGREESADTLSRFSTTLNNQLNLVQTAIDHRLTEMRETIETRLDSIQKDNGEKLEMIRATVDEKLHATLEQRLGDAFKTVRDQLEKVHSGLGEMHSLANGVGDLKRVLTNVKTRGTWGEVQLENLLDQILTKDQYGKNIETRPGSGERVEIALRLPGREEHGQVWLPIDSKFPVEDYDRLLAAQDLGDLAAIEASTKAIETRLKLEAKSIRDKYLEPPHTTDFALLFLPTEGLYAEALRRPGLTETLQRDYRITIAGPTTLTALLNSLQMGFRTLAIEKRSSEVWNVLGSLKGEFGKFGDLLAKTKEHIQKAADTIEKAETRTRQISKKLKDVETLPEGDQRIPE